MVGFGLGGTYHAVESGLGGPVDEEIKCYKANEKYWQVVLDGKELEDVLTPDEMRYVKYYDLPDDP